MPRMEKEIAALLEQKERRQWVGTFMCRMLLVSLVLMYFGVIGMVVL